MCTLVIITIPYPKNNSNFFIVIVLVLIKLPKVMQQKIYLPLRYKDYKLKPFLTLILPKFCFCNVQFYFDHRGLKMGVSLKMMIMEG